MVMAMLVLILVLVLIVVLVLHLLRVVARLEEVAVRPVGVARDQAHLAFPRDGVPEGHLLEEARVIQAWHARLLAPRPRAAGGAAAAHGLATSGALDVRVGRERTIRPEVRVVSHGSAGGVPLVLDPLFKVGLQCLVHLLAALADGIGGWEVLAAVDCMHDRTRVTSLLPGASALAALNVAVVVAGLIEVIESVDQHLALIADQPVGFVRPLICLTRWLVMFMIMLVMAHVQGAVMRGVRADLGNARDVEVNGTNVQVQATMRLLLCVRHYLLMVLLRLGLHALRPDGDQVVLRGNGAIVAPELLLNGRSKVGASDKAN
mmetsp:Transcript_80581/g.207400  ORF Transcript_80581/g.207400 Transcript_80581/m.207400 type:complete len:319 (-) Transcript_80581:230-1186(-)